jgi:hypothetical protein
MLELTPKCFDLFPEIAVRSKEQNSRIEKAVDKKASRTTTERNRTTLYRGKRKLCDDSEHDHPELHLATPSSGSTQLAPTLTIHAIVSLREGLAIKITTIHGGCFCLLILFGSGQ